MSRFRIIPVFILTRERRSGFGLKKYLEEEADLPFTVVAEVYLSPSELIPHLSPYDTNYIIIDYNEHFVDQLQSILDQPSNLVYDHEILVRSPSAHYLSKDQFKNNDAISVIQDYHDYPSIVSKIKMLIRSEKKQKKFTEANYLLAGLLMIMAIVISIVIL